MTWDNWQSPRGRQCVGYRVGLLIIISASKGATSPIFLFCRAITRLYYENPIRVSPNYFEGSTGLARSGAGFSLKFCCQIKIIYLFFSMGSLPKESQGLRVLSGKEVTQNTLPLHPHLKVTCDRWNWCEEVHQYYRKQALRLWVSILKAKM